MDRIVVRGRVRLDGEVQVSGSKNSTLALMAAALLADGETVLENAPRLRDVEAMLELLNALGARAEWESEDSHVLRIDTRGVNRVEAPYDLVRKMRASFMVLGPLLARYGSARVSEPGGCAIGVRPIDQHLKGLEALGGKVTLDHGYVEATCPKLIGARLAFDLTTVNGTQNVLMAATLARGETIIENAAREPEVVELATLLNRMGAEIRGAGSDRIAVTGVESLRPVRHESAGDRIEAGTLLAAGVITRGDVRVTGIDPALIESTLEKLRELGAEVEVHSDGARARAEGPLRGIHVTTAPFPGFPTDMQAQLMAVLTLAEGSSVVVENVFENRFMHVPELQRLGADITISGRSAHVRGVAALMGAPVMATDLRASAGLLVAGLAADGDTVVNRVYHIDRGYERIEAKLRSLGADIEKGGLSMAARSSSKGILPVLQFDAPDFEKKFRKFLGRREKTTGDVEKAVRKIVERVREGGDKELIACIRKFDGNKVDGLEVTPEEWDEGCENIDPADRAALGKAAMRIREFHRKRIPSSWEVREEGGGVFGHRVRPLERVGIYVPGGKATYPSSVIMNGVPASVVEVPEIVMATPADADGKLRPEVLMAARVAGVHRVFKMGGAQAIAALTYGTETVPVVDKIVGPGNAYVAAAKRLVFGDVAIDGEAGPTEVVIIADKTATPAWVAADLLSQAEHDEAASAILITNSKALATRVQDQLAKQFKTLERARIAKAALAGGGAIILAKNLDLCVEIANRYAPEHLVIATDDADAVSKGVKNAGAIFLGHYTPVAVGDYLAGPNHVLPTGGTARFASPLGVEDFLKRTSVVRFEPPKLRELGMDVIRLAAIEGFTGHGHSVDLRLQKIRRARREREAAREVDAEIEL